MCRLRKRVISSVAGRLRGFVIGRLTGYVYVTGRLRGCESMSHLDLWCDVHGRPGRTE